VIIPDLNVLLYLLNAESVHHASAKSWYQDLVKAGPAVGLAWVVILGFLRISTSPRVFPAPLSAEQAFDWLETFKEALAPRILEPGRGHLGILRNLLISSGTAGNLSTDAHLASLALENDATLVTFDRDFLRFPGVKIIFPDERR